MRWTFLLSAKKTIDAGTHARGGIGLKISNGGKKMSLKYLLTAKANPKGIPIIWAIIKPAKTLPELMYQLSQYPVKNTTSLHASTTSVGGGTCPIQGRVIPVSKGTYFERNSHITIKPNNATTPLANV